MSNKAYDPKGDVTQGAIPPKKKSSILDRLKGTLQKNAGYVKGTLSDTFGAMKSKHQANKLEGKVTNKILNYFPSSIAGRKNSAIQGKEVNKFVKSGDNIAARKYMQEQLEKALKQQSNPELAKRLEKLKKLNK